jgi:hypothetical protein
VNPAGLIGVPLGVRRSGPPEWSPGRLGLVSVLQIAEDLTDRQAAAAAQLD